MRIGEKIAELRKRENLNQSELAEKLKLNQSVLNRIENGSRPLKDDEIKLFASFFGVSSDFLLDIPKKEGWLYSGDNKTIEIAEKSQHENSMFKLFAAAQSSSPKNLLIATNLLEQLNDNTC
jgi:transcriptional regulator with XRE-family HTH domain